jgi:hypothetical protein
LGKPTARTPPKVADFSMLAAHLFRGPFRTHYAPTPYPDGLLDDDDARKAVAAL